MRRLNFPFPQFVPKYDVTLSAKRAVGVRSERLVKLKKDPQTNFRIKMLSLLIYKEKKKKIKGALRLLGQQRAEFYAIHGEMLPPGVSRASTPPADHKLNRINRPSCESDSRNFARCFWKEKTKKKHHTPSYDVCVISTTKPTEIAQGDSKEGGWVRRAILVSSQFTLSSM